MLHHIENKTNEKIPRIPFQKISTFVLKQGYELSLVFVTNKISQEINKQYRDKDYPTNILSFPLSKNDGEILIDISVVRREAKDLGEKESTYLAYIFIHGLTHLNEFDHGSRMEEEEHKIRTEFKHLFKSSNLL